MPQPMHKAITTLVAVVYLALIMNGYIDHPDQIPGEVDEWDLQCLAGAMMIENGYNTEECVFLTGAVVLNRLYSDNWKGDTIEEIILAKGQYAQVTRNGFRTKEATNRVKAIAKYLLLYYEPGFQVPEDVVYQSQRVLGHGKYIDGKLVHEYRRIPVPGQKDEIFCYE